LNGHLKRLPDQDTRSRAILRQMRIDEGRHATKARAAGGVRLPYPIRVAMKGTARVMTSTTYWV
jgi:ubiquinone biosynthesis monooxygenase Coq7